MLIRLIIKEFLLELEIVHTVFSVKIRYIFMKQVIISIIEVHLGQRQKDLLVKIIQILQ